MFDLPSYKLHAEQKMITVYMSASVIEDLQDSLPNL